MRVGVFVLAALALGSPARGDSPLARLADAAAGEILRSARGRPVELPLPEDRTGRGAGLALDLHALIAARLEGRISLSEKGPRLRVASVVSESPGRLLFSARVVDEPGGRLRDLLSVSVPAEANLLTLMPLRPAPASGEVELIASSRTPPLTPPVLDLAFLTEDRLVVLSAEEVALYRLDENGLSLLSRRPLPGPLETVRFPGGILRAFEGEAAFWALSSRSPRARLFGVEGDHLVERHEAEALPWPGSAGLRYRAGTNLIEGQVAGLGDGPFLDVEASEGGAAVTADGRLIWGDGSDLRVGPTLAGLWPGLLAASSATPPGGRDSLLLLGKSGSGTRVVATLPVEGSVRALASRRSGRRTRLVAAVDDGDRGSHLLVMDLAPGGS